MLTFIADLQTAVQSQSPAVNASNVNQAALKKLLDEVLAALADARANALSAEDKAAIEAATAAIIANTQALADSTAVNAPGN